MIQSDAKRLKQILINLVGNAIKFTHRGSVEVHTKFDDRLRRLQIEVIDTGIGISASHLKQIFRPFSQGDASVSRKFGGTGLGLTISQRLAELLGGSLAVESVEGLGSTFTLTIKTGVVVGSQDVGGGRVAALVESAFDARAGELPRLTCHVLVVDDRRDIRFLSRHILTQSGATVEECEDGLVAVARMLELLNDGSVPDLVLLDMQMPNLDGYATAGQLRSIGYTGPIIALTADAMQSDMNKCLEVGCNDYLSKPIDKSLLLCKVAQWTS